jgi:hypothetical protein
MCGSTGTREGGKVVEVVGGGERGREWMIGCVADVVVCVCGGGGEREREREREVGGEGRRWRGGGG